MWGETISTVVEAPTNTPRQTSAVAYYPGCSLHGTSPEYDESLQAVVAALGIALAEIPDWNCCGASSGRMVNHDLAVALPARNLALAEAQGFDKVLAPCAACYNRLLVAHQTLQEDADLAGRMPEILGREFANTVDVLSVTQLLHDVREVIAERVAAAPIERTSWAASSWPLTTAACSSGRRRSPAATTSDGRSSWTTWSPPAAPSPSTGT